MRDMETAFYSGEVSFDELCAAYDRAAQVRAAIARGESRLPDGSYVAFFSAVVGPDGTARIDIGTGPEEE